MNPSTPTRHQTQDTRHASAARDVPSRAALAQQLLVTRQLSDLLPALEQRNIRSVLLKGTAFWTCLYEPGERPVSDIDLLVHPRDFEQAKAALIDLGYERYEAENRPATTRAYYNHGFRPARGQPGTVVELHRCLTHPIRYDIDMDGLVDRAEPCVAGRTRAWRLSPEDALLHLAIHRSMHFGGFDEDPRNHEDAHRIVSQRHIDWDSLAARAGAWGCATVLWILLDSIARRHGTPVPADVLGRIQPSRVRIKYLGRALHRFNGAWTLRRQDLPGWQRRFAVFPLQLDRPGQFARSAWFYGTTRLRDLLEPLRGNGTSA